MCIKKAIAIGQSDFKEIIQQNCYYVDKSLFIKEILEDASQIILLPRPRRFGKTLNMTMLKYFFENSEQSNKHLFEGLKISKYEECMKHQGKYPVIYLTFKDVKCTTWEECLNSIKFLISKIFGNFRYLLNSDVLYSEEKKLFYCILNSNNHMVYYVNALKELCEYLYRYYKVKPIILIDEYDVPIQSGFMNNYYDEVIEFVRNFLCAALKDNQNLHKCVLTGILRIAKESLFSGLNNPRICTITDNPYSDKFGFVDNEVFDMLECYNIGSKMEEVREWYNGYIFSETLIYNPWSIISYVADNTDYKKGFSPYWVNTSDNAIIKNIVARGDEELKIEIQNLIEGKEIEKPINADIVMEDIEKDNDNIWNFLLFTGHLKVVSKDRRFDVDYYKLKIPNKEVLYLYNQIIINWFVDNRIGTKLKKMLVFLTQGNVASFSRLFKQLVLATFSYFDITNQEPERVYQAFVLGMFINLKDSYEVKSNRESGLGRADVLLIPKDITKLGIIIEFKTVYKDEGETLEMAVDNALEQIEKKQYEIELIDIGIRNILKIGIGFCGKEVFIKSIL